MAMTTFPIQGSVAGNWFNSKWGKVEHQLGHSAMTLAMSAQSIRSKKYYMNMAQQHFAKARAHGFKLP